MKNRYKSDVLKGTQRGISQPKISKPCRHKEGSQMIHLPVHAGQTLHLLLLLGRNFEREIWGLGVQKTLLVLDRGKFE